MIEIIRVITEQQIALTARLADEIWREYYVPIIGHDQVDYMLAQFQSSAAIKNKIDCGELIYFLMYFHRQPAGYFAIQIRTDEVFLSKLYVLAGQRNRGLAKKALNFVKNVTSENCLQRISLTINKNNNESLAAYKKLGFKISGEIINDIGNGFFMDDFILQLSLPG